MKRTIVIPVASAAVALIVGIGIGGSGNASADPTAAPAPTPTTTTVTTPGKTKTVTETVEVTPQACVDALDDAVKAITLEAGFVKIAANYPAMIYRAAKAGANLDTATIYAISDEVKGYTAQIQEINRKVETLTPQVGRHSSACRAGAE